MRILFVIALFSLLLSTAVMAQDVPEDKTAVRILGYFMVGRDDVPEANVTIEQFTQHLEILKNEDFNVISLPDMTQAYKSNTPLPDKSVAITFDGGDKSILTNATPLLEQYNFPYTIFIATDRADQNDPRYLNWKDIKNLEKTGLVTIGLHPQTYASLTFDTPQNIEKRINNATARLRNQGIDNIEYFSYPFGENSKNYDDIISRYNFHGVVGQQSGVAYNSSPESTLPRFMMTEAYADADRFNMVINSLPLPLTDITPITSVIKTKNPAIGFTIRNEINDELDKLSCFVSGQNKPNTVILGNRVELRLTAPITQERLRVNCTLPVNSENAEKTTSWRWLGFLFHVNDTVLKTVEN